MMSCRKLSDRGDLYPFGYVSVGKTKISLGLAQIYPSSLFRTVTTKVWRF